VSLGRHSKSIRNALDNEFRPELQRFTKKHADSPDQGSMEKMKEILKSVMEAVGKFFSAIVRGRPRA
jgi:hypothetical protein